MRKTLLFATFFSLLITSCSSVIKTNTLASVEIESEVETLPLTADLVVSEQKTRGEASGKVGSKNRLEREALAMALGQIPPSADKPDVLVGVNYFTEVQGSELKIMLTGYPAYYTNFRTATEKDSLRLGMVSTKQVGKAVSSQAYVEKPKKEKQERRWRGYFSFRYHIDDAFGFGLEAGMFWPSGFFMSFEAVEAFSNCNLHAKDKYGFNLEVCLGGGGNLNFGNRFEMPNQSQIDVGLSVGVWGVDYVYEELRIYDGRNYQEYDYDLEKFYFGGPFVKAQWDVFEIGYRMLLGMVFEDIHSWSSNSNLFAGVGKDGFDIKHLFMLGVTF